MNAIMAMLLIYNSNMQMQGWSATGPMTMQQCEATVAAINEKTRPGDWTDVQIRKPLILECKEL